jgi:sulfur carrier protein ThiS adenylyltransferase
MPFSFDSVTTHYYSKEQLERLALAKIGIAGVGGLGSNCAVNLVRSGVTQIVIADFDVIENSNLNRQAFFANQVGMTKVSALTENVLKINPAVHITPHCLQLDRNNMADVFKGCDVVVEAFDRAECKALLVETLLPTGVFMVTASGIAGIGNSDRIKVHKILNNLYMVGDKESAVSASAKPYAPCVAIAAAKQADIVLEWILTGQIFGGGLRGPLYPS